MAGAGGGNTPLMQSYISDVGRLTCAMTTSKTIKKGNKVAFPLFLSCGSGCL